MVLKTVKGKVKLAHRNTTPEAQRGSVGTVQHISEFGTKGVWVVNSTPGSFYPQEGAMVYMVWEADRDTWPFWVSGKRENLIYSPWLKLRKNVYTIQAIVLRVVTPRR